MTTSQYWEFQLVRDYDKLLGDNMWNRQHPEVHEYLQNYLLLLGNATTLEDFKLAHDGLIIFRDKQKLLNLEEKEKEIYDKYIKRFE